MVLNTILFDLKNSAGIQTTRFCVAGYVNLKESSRSKTNGYFTKNYKLLVCDLEQHTYEQGNWKIFFCFCVLIKKLCDCLCRCFSFCSSPQCFWTAHCFLYVWLIVVVCTSGSILGHTWEKVSGKCSIDLKLFVWEH